MLESVMLLFKYFPELNAGLGAGILIFARFLGFITTAPVIGRKDLPFMFKLIFSLLMTVAFVGLLKPQAPPEGTSLILSIFLNAIFGSLLGFVANLIFAAIGAAGDMINMQMGLSSAMMFDPSSREQISVMGKFFSFLGTIIFINIGGLYWIFSAFERSFDVFPIYNTVLPLQKFVNIDYITLLTGNVLFFGLQVASPVLLATLAMDVILGIISKTAPQINVFQLSFLFKPVLGVAIMIILMPLMVNIINDYFLSFSQIY